MSFQLWIDNIVYIWKLLGTILFPHKMPVDSEMQKHTEAQELDVYVNDMVDAKGCVLLLIFLGFVCYL